MRNFIYLICIVGLFFIMRLCGFLKISKFRYYTLFLEFLDDVLAKYRSKHLVSVILSKCVDELVQTYSEQELLLLLILVNIFVKILGLCLIIFQFLFNFNLLLSCILFILLLILVVIYCLLLEINNFCYHQSIMASDEFDFFEFVEETATKQLVYRVINIDVFDFEKFHNTKNHFQLKKEKQKEYEDLDLYTSLVHRLTFFPICYRKTCNVLNLYININLVFNLLFCVAGVIILYLLN